ncbi:DUF5131 family protein [Paenibacillus ihumii]|uniref:DUF5131 family protein n=1 Tax=Paenibacillus ihumii TaxID=687436 RepID=UPI0006D77224|nr:phage Gp37/Gp68 family protein [Paenibacillus ihumii]
MSDKTGIEWADATWNPVTGCTKVSEGCRNCYAKTFTERFEGTPGHYFETGFKVTVRPEKLDQPLRWKRPRRIFVNSMSDLFHPDVPDGYIDQVFAVMALCPQHTFQVLTKRPERMLEYITSRRENICESLAFEAPDGQRVIDLLGGEWIPPQIGEFGRVEIKGYFDNVEIPWPLPNVWLGVSVENQKAADERTPLLLQTPAAVRFLSCEPLLGPVIIPEVFMNRIDWGEGPRDWPDGAGIIDWIIAGGESGRGARPMHPNWARSLRDQCQAAGISFFFKQWGEFGPVNPTGLYDPEYWVTESGMAGHFHTSLPTDYEGQIAYMDRDGKKRTGRMLDGRTWDEFPQEGQP